MIDEDDITGTGREGRASKKKGRSSARRKPIKTKTINTEFAVVSYAFAAVFVALILYLSYFLIFKSEDFISSPYNSRVKEMDEDVIRGNIYSADKVLLATTKILKDGTEERIYPEGRMYAHVVGYSTKGMSGLELDANFSLLRSHSSVGERLTNDLTGEKNVGDSVVTTLDSEIQAAAYKSLSTYDGAVIVMDPETGEILAMVSEPSFDPNTLTRDWEFYMEDSESGILVNRATQGQYPPGSTYKIVTALAYLRSGGKTEDMFHCGGSYGESSDEEDEYIIHCYNNKAHGDEDLITAFAKSCNVAFSQVALKIPYETYLDTNKDLLFNTTPPVSFSNAKGGSFSLKENDKTDMWMQTGIGQGETLVSPLQMLMIASAVANDGVLMRPYLIDHTENSDGITVDHYSKSSYGALISKEEAATLKRYMRAVITDGTGTDLDVENYTAYGKTGTAEYSTENKDLSHSWFVGFAERGDKKLAIAVILEGKNGEVHALPVAKAVFDACF